MATGRDQTASVHAWQVYELGDPRIRLDLTAVALSGDDVVGYTTLVALDDGAVGGHRVLTVLPAWNARGIGAALTRAQIAAAESAGFRSLLRVGASVAAPRSVRHARLRAPDREHRLPGAAAMTVEIRPVSGYGELERWVAARNEVLTDDPDSAEMMALVRASELEHVDLLAYEDGEILGTGLLGGDPESVESSHPYVEVTVPERHRGRGVGAALLAELSERARRLGKEGLVTESRAHDAYSIAFLERRGFVELGRSAKYVLELSTYEEPEASQAEGVDVVMLADRPDLLPGMYEVAESHVPRGGRVPGKAGREPPRVAAVPPGQSGNGARHDAARGRERRGDRVRDVDPPRRRPHGRAPHRGRPSRLAAARDRHAASPHPARRSEASRLGDDRRLGPKRARRPALRDEARLRDPSRDDRVPGPLQ